MNQKCPSSVIYITSSSSTPLGNLIPETILYWRNEELRVLLIVFQKWITVSSSVSNLNVLQFEVTTFDYFSRIAGCYVEAMDVRSCRLSKV